MDVSGTARILIVDDEANTRAALAELLRDEDFDVEVAAHAFDALCKIEKFHPDVAIVDVQARDGTEVVSQLIGSVDAPSVIAMTPYGETGAAVAALRAGASDYLAKPLRFDELLIVLG